LRALTLAMKLDVLLFGRVRSGPFFALLERQGAEEAEGAGPTDLAQRRKDAETRRR